VLAGTPGLQTQLIEAGPHALAFNFDRDQPFKKINISIEFIED
jgi:hypothetical protein